MSKFTDIFKPHGEVKRNVPSIDRALFIIRASVTAVVCLAMTFLCTWLSYAVQSTEDVLTFSAMLEYLEKSKTFMTSYIICAFIMWGVIGFVLATLIVKAIKYFINYK